MYIYIYNMTVGGQLDPDRGVGASKATACPPRARGGYAQSGQLCMLVQYISIVQYSIVQYSIHIYIYIYRERDTFIYIYIYIHILYIHMFICLFIFIAESLGLWGFRRIPFSYTANLPSNIVGFKGFDSSTILIQRGGIPRPKGNFPESLSQAMLVGITLVGKLGVPNVPFGSKRSRWLALFARNTTDHLSSSSK